LTTRESIIELADNLIRSKGYNAFSFYDISRSIGIKTASIHYHFPSKSDLGIAVVMAHRVKLQKLKMSLEGKDPLKQLHGFFSVYSGLSAEQKVCLVGSLATDLNTVDEKVQEELKIFTREVWDWVVQILKEGKKQKVFSWKGSPRVKALMIINNMLATVQLNRLTTKNNFIVVRNAIIRELKSEK
jgi:AcrR family transcriptional regulator